MTSIDIEILTNGQRFIKYGDKNIYFKDITVKEYAEIQKIIQDTLAMQIQTYEGAIKQEEILKNILKLVFINPDDIEYFTRDHLIELYKYFPVMDLQDQGFTDIQINKMTSKQTVKNNKKEKYTIDFMYMLHRMASENSWSHDEMMNMNKRVFYRYYGYWYQDKLREQEAQEEQEKQRKNDERMNKLRQQAR